ncbi:hypothetical protein NP493_487g02041 [Ridgeia piscesae]|uniref:Uncharacterized protein n=1 Tax=Ridgeia piscesae TaxID=27915 RepID=A0AAD9KXH9_RIDPI|nr:hypothetical protein NP493_487g02041 [Ridgeia piscesae]
MALFCWCGGMNKYSLWAVIARCRSRRSKQVQSHRTHGSNVGSFFSGRRVNKRGTGLNECLKDSVLDHVLDIWILALGSAVYLQDSVRTLPEIGLVVLEAGLYQDSVIPWSRHSLIPFPLGVDWDMVQRQDLGDGGMEPAEHEEEVKMPVRGHVKNLIRLFSNGLVTGKLNRSSS